MFGDSGTRYECLSQRMLSVLVTGELGEWVYWVL